jgi:predicted N-acetyltransferase YhbS
MMASMLQSEVRLLGGVYTLIRMFTVRLLTPEDYDFAVQLANTMNWNMAPEDFQYMASLDPDGSFLLEADGKPVGIATCIGYGKVGWFGNLIVDPAYRKKGAGGMLVCHAVDYLHAKGVETVGLYAYPQLKEFYGKLGFKADIDFALLRADNVVAVEGTGAHRIEEAQLKKIATFDSYYFGGDRSQLIQSIVLEDGNAGYYATDGGHVVGYVAATIYSSMAWIGPLVCDPSKRYAFAGRLVSSVLSKVAGKSVYTVAPKNDAVLLDLLSSIGFKEEFTVTRMYNGISSAKNCIYLAESLERG